MGANNIFLIGANSGIARACLDLWAGPEARAYLVGRNPGKLAETRGTFEEKGGVVPGSEVVDFTELTGEEMEAVLDRGFAALGRVDCFFLASGILPNQRELEQAPPDAGPVIQVNYTRPVQLLMHAANRMEEQGSGCLAALSSVAGDTGRRSNYLYGSTKAGLSTVLEGLDARFGTTAVRVLDIRPGPVKTPMVAHLEQGKLFADPETVARRIVRAIAKGKRGRIYAPAHWRCIMCVIRHLPAFIRRRLDF